MRLHALTSEQLEEWKRTRMESGRGKYHHLDHKRNLMVDVVEEAIDIQNIMERFAKHQSVNNGESPELEESCWDMILASNDIIEAAMYISNHLDDMDDSCGGHRVWWSEESKVEHPAEICMTCNSYDICNLMRATSNDKKCLRLKKRILLKKAFDALKKYFELEEYTNG